jgi:hypothetical protein
MSAKNGKRQLSLFDLLTLPLDEARPYVECDICAAYNSGGLLYLCPEKDEEHCLHTNWTPDNIRWWLFHCARRLIDCPFEKPCSGELVSRKNGRDKSSPDRSRIIRECPHACPEVYVGGDVLAKYSHLAHAFDATECGPGHWGQWVTLEEIEVLRKGGS